MNKFLFAILGLCLIFSTQAQNGSQDGAGNTAEVSSTDPNAVADVNTDNTNAADPLTNPAGTTDNLTNLDSNGQPVDNSNPTTPAAAPADNTTNTTTPVAAPADNTTNTTTTTTAPAVAAVPVAVVPVVDNGATNVETITNLESVAVTNAEGDAEDALEDTLAAVSEADIPTDEGSAAVVEAVTAAVEANVEAVNGEIPNVDVTTGEENIITNTGANANNGVVAGAAVAGAAATGAATTGAATTTTTTSTTTNPDTNTNTGANNDNAAAGNNANGAVVPAATYGKLMTVSSAIAIMLLTFIIA